MADVPEVNLSRQALYELVWSTPRSKLCKAYATSDVGLAKLCTRLRIPMPARGHWMRREPRPEAPPLPPLKTEPPAVSLGLRDPTAAPAVRPRPPVPEVALSEADTEEHPIVNRTRAALNKAKPGYQGTVELQGKGLAGIRVAPGSIDRALRVLDSVLRAMEERGHEVEAGDGFRPRTTVTISGQTVHFAIRERLDRRDHVLTAEELERQDQGRWTWAPKYDFSPSGRLRLQIDDVARTGVRQTWSDGKKQKLEGMLGKIVVGLEEASAATAERDRELEAQRLRWEAEARERDEARRREEEAAERAREFLAIARDWAAARDARAFVDHLSALRPADSDPDWRDWLTWARTVIERLDPATSIVDGTFDWGQGRSLHTNPLGGSLR